MIIKILGAGCSNCKKLELNTQEAIKRLNLNVTIEKISDINLIIKYGIMSTPALVVDDQILSYGRIPDITEIETMLTSHNLNKSKTKWGPCPFSP